MKKYIVIIVLMFLSVGLFVGFYKGIDYAEKQSKGIEVEKPKPVYQVNSVNILNVTDSMVNDKTIKEEASEPLGSTATEPYTSDEVLEQESEQQEPEIDEATSDDIPGLIHMTVSDSAKILNIRSAPNTESRIVKSMKSGEEVWVYEDSMTDGFYRIYSEDDKEMWAYSLFLTPFK